MWRLPCISRNPWLSNVGIVGLSLLGILFTYCVCVTAARMGQVLPRWARQNGFRIVHSETRTFFQGPFFVNRYAPIYRITVEDHDGRQKKGWVRIGDWYFVGFRENVEVRWDE